MAEQQQSDDLLLRLARALGYGGDKILDRQLSATGDYMRALQRTPATAPVAAPMAMMMASQQMTPIDQARLVAWLLWGGAGNAIGKWREGEPVTPLEAVLAAADIVGWGKAATGAERLSKVVMEKLIGRPIERYTAHPAYEYIARLLGYQQPEEEGEKAPASRR